MSKTHVAKAKCTECNDIIISEHGGHFVTCPCGKSSIDQERWAGLYVRTLGKAELIERICPEGCKDHKENLTQLFKNDYEK